MLVFEFGRVGNGKNLRVIVYKGKVIRFSSAQIDRLAWMTLNGETLEEGKILDT